MSMDRDDRSSRYGGSEQQMGRGGDRREWRGGERNDNNMGMGGGRMNPGDADRSRFGGHSSHNYYRSDQMGDRNYGGGSRMSGNEHGGQGSVPQRFDQHGGQSGDQWHSQGSGGFGQAPMGGSYYGSSGGERGRGGSMGSRDQGSQWGGGSQGYSGQGAMGQGGFAQQGAGQFGHGRMSDHAPQGYDLQRYGPQGQPGHHDPDYRNWRDQQMEAFDRDYDEFRRHRQDRFSAEFEEWRRNREQSRGGMGASGSDARISTTQRDASRSGGDEDRGGSAGGLGRDDEPRR